jgi:uncharacterized protein (TIGR02117 family)
MGLVLFYVGTVFLLPLITVNKEEVVNKDIEIHILTNGVHTDIVVPVKTTEIDWSQKIKYSNSKNADSTYQYLAMGWGDKGFYLETPNWSDLKASVALNAAFGLSTTAIHATYYKKITLSKTCKRMVLSNKQYAKLVKYLMSSFKKNSVDEYMLIDTDVAYGKTDAFYEAKGSYSVLTTCNTWANNALKISGQKCCFWTALDWGIFSKY